MNLLLPFGMATLGFAYAVAVSGLGLLLYGEGRAAWEYGLIGVAPALLGAWLLDRHLGVTRVWDAHIPLLAGIVSGAGLALSFYDDTAPLYTAVFLILIFWRQRFSGTGG